MRAKYCKPVINVYLIGKVDMLCSSAETDGFGEDKDEWYFE